jgi:hypothetical protein
MLDILQGGAINGPMETDLICFDQPFAEICASMDILADQLSKATGHTIRWRTASTDANWSKLGSFVVEDPVIPTPCRD